jgi:hypothetical protein
VRGALQRLPAGAHSGFVHGVALNRWLLDEHPQTL